MRIEPRDGIQSAFEKIDELCTKTVESGARLSGITAEAARLRAYSTFLSVEESQRSATQLTGALDRLTSATIDGADRLARWTQVLAFATVALFLATLALVLATFMH